jgi:hypothetical protein
MDDWHWIYISLPHATYALGIDAGGMVRMAPPIARWMVGKPERDVAAWLLGRYPKMTAQRI